MPTTDPPRCRRCRRYDGLSTDAYVPDHPAMHVLELLAEVQRLTDELDVARKQRDFAIDANRKLITSSRRLNDELDAANDSIRAIRSWATSRLEILHHPQHLPHSSVHAAQVTVLDDLGRVLDVLERQKDTRAGDTAAEETAR
jgi:hypothetical protein